MLNLLFWSWMRNKIKKSHFDTGKLLLFVAVLNHTPHSPPENPFLEFFSSSFPPGLNLKVPPLALRYLINAVMLCCDRDSGPLSISESHVRHCECPKISAGRTDWVAAAFPSTNLAIFLICHRHSWLLFVFLAVLRGFESWDIPLLFWASFISSVTEWRIC